MTDKFDINILPQDIAKIVKTLPYKCDNIGESKAFILIYDNMVLKIEKTGVVSENERKILSWLDGKLPVPKIISFTQKDGYNYILMTKIKSDMACYEMRSSSPEETVKALADGLKMLWSVDIYKNEYSEIPAKNGLDQKLAAAKYNIENNLVDMDDFNDDTFGENGFADVWDLYKFLCENRPEEDLVFSHGDYCLPNIFIEGDRAVGFIDFGSAGIADKWQDIALCVRSMEYNLVYCEKHTKEEFDGYRSLFFKESGLSPDETKIRYYILLDELF